MQTSNSQEVGCEHQPAQGPRLTLELRDFIQQIIVPILVDRYNEGRKKDGERAVGQFDHEIFNR
jgi:hypothetical protein